MNKDLFELSYSLKKDFERKVLSVVVLLACVFVFLSVILNYVVFPLRMNSVSMSPDVSKDSVVFFSPFKKTIHRGDVVLLNPRTEENGSLLFRAADTFVTFFTARQFSLAGRENLMGNYQQVRRVAAVPGDSIYMRDYVLYIKPEGEKFYLTEFELIDGKYNVNINAAPAMWDSSIGVAGSFDEFTLGENQYFVLADSRNSAMDSRMWGPVDIKKIKASALFSIFPFNKAMVF